MDTSSATTAGTFVDSKIFGGIYFYTYILITFVIIFGAYHFSGQIPLYRQSYRMLHDVESSLGKIRLAMKGLERKLDPQTSAQKRVALNCVDLELINNLINIEFVRINNTINKHKQFLINKAADIGNIQNTGNNYNNQTHKPTVIAKVKEQQTNDQKNKQNEITNKQSSQNQQRKQTPNVISGNGYDDADDKQCTQITLNGFSHIESGDTITDEMTAQIILSATSRSSNVGTIATGGQINGSTYFDESEVKLQSQLQDKKWIQLNNFLDKEYAKLRMNNTHWLKSYIRILWDLRSLLIAVIAHFFDTASDIALIIEWYILQKRQNEDTTGEYLKDIDMQALFYCSLWVLIYYRIESMAEIYRFSQSLKDSILQFLFDFYLIKAIYVNIYKMHSYKALPFVKLVRSLEGSTESTFQAILALVFLIKTDWNERDTTAIISLITSLYSLISRLTFQDSAFLNENAKKSNVTFQDIFHYKCTWIRKINTEFINFSLFRSIDTLTTMYGIALVWHIFGGLWIGLIFGPLYVYYSIHNKATAVSSNLLTINLYDYGKIWKIGSYCVVQIGDYYRPKRFIAFRICWVTVLMVLFIVDIFVSNDIITNYKNEQRWDSKTNLYLLCSVCGCWVLATIVLPIWYIKWIVTYVVPLSERTTISRHLSLKHAVSANNIEFVEFARHMGVKTFFTSKYIVWQRNLKYCLWFDKNKYKIFKKRLIFAFITAEDKLNAEMYYFFRDWYYDSVHNEYMRIDGDDSFGNFGSMSFEQYLMCKESDKYIQLIKEKNCNLIVELLRDNGLVLDNFKGVQGVSKTMHTQIS